MHEVIDITMPQKLDDNLLLRWGRPEDADAVAEFNVRMHSDNPPEREEWLADWTRDLMSGQHPTTSAKEFTIVEDLNSGAIVSTQVLIPQTWRYDGIPFGVGRIELVGTEEAFRRRGLVRKQMEAAHALSAQMGHQVQAITGIPWFYRQFGYEMTINLGGGRKLFWARKGNDKPLEKEPYTIRPASEADFADLDKLYRIHCANSLVMRERTEAMWRFEVSTANRNSIGAVHAYMINNEQDQTVAYAAFFQEGSGFTVTELGVKPGHSWRSVALFIVRELKRRAAVLNKEREKPITQINFPLSENHPVIAALGGQLEKMRLPYAWYIRVPDVHGFLGLISSALEKRLIAGVVAGHTGTLRFNFYTDTLRMEIKEGKIAEIGRYEPDHVEDGDALFPSLTFLQLLFGYRSIDELDRSYADCYATNEEAAVLLRTLFPVRPSNIWALN